MSASDISVDDTHLKDSELELSRTSGDTLISVIDIFDSLKP